MRLWIVTLIALVFGATAGVGSADDASVGRTLGEAGKAVVEDSRSAYESSREFVIDAGRNMAQGAREAAEAAKDIGPRLAEDVKSGFQGGGQAPDPTAEKKPAAEKP